MQIASQEASLAYGTTSPSVTEFLSDSNQAKLNGYISSAVNRKTSGRINIGPQSQSDLRAIMTTCIDGQLSVREMNELAVDRAVRIIMSNLTGYLHYLNHMKAVNSWQNDEAARLTRPVNTRDSKELLMPSLF